MEQVTHQVRVRPSTHTKAEKITNRRNLKRTKGSKKVSLADVFDEGVDLLALVDAGKATITYK